jgi:hypothetical protein
VKLEGVSIKMWFKNEGQAAARVLALATMPALTDHILSASEEEDDFNRAVRDWSVKGGIDIEPGHDAPFASPDFLNKQQWAEFQAGTKYLYSFLTVSYVDADQDYGDEIVTESCIWFQNTGSNFWSYCQTPHNKTFRRTK